MKKVITVNGCKDCPYKYHGVSRWYCGLTDILISEFELPDTPHPNCKLNDLPTKDEIQQNAISDTHDRYNQRVWERAANWVIDKITK